MIKEIVKEYFLNEEWINLIVGYITIIGFIVPLVLWVILKTIYLYKLKRFSKLKRPDWLTEEEIEFLVKYYVKTKVNDVDNRRLNFNQFIKKIILKSKKQYHIILGESGSGKSSFLVNLYYRYQCRIFQHDYKIKYISLRLPNAIEEILKIENKKQTILLLDGFDESDSANVDANNYFILLESETRYFAKVIITSRNNFFDDDNFLPPAIHPISLLLLKQNDINRYYICQFSKLDIIHYILKKYKFRLYKEIKAFLVISVCNEMSSRPLILSYIDLLIGVPKIYKNLLEVYRSIVINWIQREVRYIISIYKNEDSNDIQEKMISSVNEIAIYMYANFPKQRDYYIKIKDLNRISEIDLLEHMDGKRSRSLFNRVGDKLYFAHKSLLEYLLAENFGNYEFRYETNLNMLYKFLKEINEKNRSANYNAIFHINYTGIDSKIDDMKDYIRVYSYDVYLSSRKEIEDILSWYYKASSLPVFINRNLYDRNLIEIKFREQYAYKLAKTININQVIEKITRHYKECFANHETFSITIVTFLTLKSR